jgi:hypothetical protein
MQTTLQPIEDEVLVPLQPDEETEDGRVRNREAIAKIRDIWIYSKVRARQEEFTQYRKVRVRIIGTRTMKNGYHVVV